MNRVKDAIALAMAVSICLGGFYAAMLIKKHLEMDDALLAWVTANAQATQRAAYPEVK